MKAIGDFSGKLRQPGVDPGDIDRNIGVRIRAGIEKRRHQAKFVILAAEIKPFAILPGIPKSADGENLLAQLADN